MLNKLIISTLAAYVAVDLTRWYTIPEKLICCIGFGLIIAAAWTKIEEIKFDPRSGNSRSQ